MSEKFTAIEAQEIMKLLPHRYPFLLVDRVVDLIPTKEITVIKNVTINEPFFQGHFPIEPVMPGVLIVEAMAQAGGILAIKSIDGDAAGKVFYFASIKEAKFKRPVRPGDQLQITAKFEKRRGIIAVMKCEARVEGKIVSTATISATVPE